jgi:hypothetical protein
MGILQHAKDNLFVLVYLSEDYMLELITMILMGVLLIVPFYIFQLWYWAALFTVIGLAVAVAEIVSTAKKNKTISQQFWAWSIENKWKAWVVAACLAGGWGILIWHLLSKIT